MNRNCMPHLETYPKHEAQNHQSFRIASFSFILVALHEMKSHFNT